MSDKLRYKDINLVKACVDFEGSTKLERARKLLLIYLSVIIFYEAAGITITSVSPIFFQGTIKNPDIVYYALWVLFIYSLTVYFSIFQKEIKLFLFTSANENSFFVELNRRELYKKMQKTSIPDYLRGASGLVTSHKNNKTVVAYSPSSRDKVKEIPDEIINMEHYEHDAYKYTYNHQPGDLEFYNKVRSIIPPAVSFNYLVYKLPLHVSTALILYKLFDIFYSYITANFLKSASFDGALSYLIF